MTEQQILKFQTTLERIAKAFEAQNVIQEKIYELYKKMYNPPEGRQSVEESSSDAEEVGICKSEVDVEEKLVNCKCSHPADVHGPTGCMIENPLLPVGFCECEAIGASEWNFDLKKTIEGTR